MRFLVQALGLTAGGGQELTLNLLSNLSLHTEHEFVALLPEQREYAVLENGNLRLVFAAKPGGLFARDRILNQIVPTMCSQVGADALLCLGNFGPRRAPCPTIVLVQNAYLAYRESVIERKLTLREKLVVVYGRAFCRFTLPRMHVIAQTETMKRRLGQYRLDPDRVTVIPNAPFFPDGIPERTRKRDEGDCFTFVDVTRYYAHKNLEVFLEAVPILLRLTPRSFRVLITISANQHPGARKFLKNLEKSGLQRLLINVGPVPAARLQEIYSFADALAMPTLLESFSRTYLEAMHFGLPIVTSDRDFARERCQDAAVYFDPLDPESVAKAMAKVMEDAELRKRLVENGERILAKSPTWEEITARFVEVLERVARGSSIADAGPEPGPTRVSEGDLSLHGN